MSDKIVPITGCYVDGHWGQYAIARVIIVAKDFDYDNNEAVSLAAKHLDSMGPSTSPDLTSDEMEMLVEFCDDAEMWLNQNVCRDGYSWNWNDGEFFYQNNEWWNEE